MKYRFLNKAVANFLSFWVVSKEKDKTFSASYLSLYGYK